jgi:hypothetical protein
VRFEPRGDCWIRVPTGHVTSTSSPLLVARGLAGIDVPFGGGRRSPDSPYGGQRRRHEAPRGSRSRPGNCKRAGVSGAVQAFCVRRTTHEPSSLPLLLPLVHQLASSRSPGSAVATGALPEEGPRGADRQPGKKGHSADVLSAASFSTVRVRVNAMREVKGVSHQGPPTKEHTPGEPRAIQRADRQRDDAVLRRRPSAFHWRPCSFPRLFLRAE